jgi:hypothetical protein
MSNALVGGSLYFKNGIGSTTLKNDLDWRQVSLVLLPPLQQQALLRESLLSTTDDDGLGLIYTDDSKLYMCVTPSFKGKTECIDHVCAKIKLLTRNDIMNTKISSTRIKSCYMTKVLNET